MARFLMPFEAIEPSTVDEAVQLLARFGNEAKILAGGTDLIISLKNRLLNPKYVVSLQGIPGLDSIRHHPGEGLVIGSLATHGAIADSPIVQHHSPLLSTACGKVGTPQVRNMGTLGGNICMAGPSQDSPPALLALDAKATLVGPNGPRVIPLETFFVAPFRTVIQESEILTEIQIPDSPARSAGCYKWLTKVTSVDETLVGVAVFMSLDSAREKCSDLRIALCSVAPTVFRAKRAERMLKGKELGDELVERAAETAAEETKPRSRADYRRRMTKLLVAEAIHDCWQKL